MPSVLGTRPCPFTPEEADVLLGLVYGSPATVEELAARAGKPLRKRRAVLRGLIAMRAVWPAPPT